MVMGQISDRELHEECGVFGVFGVKDAASLTYYGLHALQHRGPSTGTRRSAASRAAAW